MIKFKRLTIALAALFITSATAWAQTEQTVAVTPVTGQTNQWTLAMPAGNVTLNVEYAPAFTATFKALTANTIQAGKATVTLTDNTEGAQPQSATPDADGKLTPVYEGQTITLTAAEGYKFRTVTATKGAAAAVTTATPLTMECLTDGTIKVDMGSGTLSSGMQYAVNGGAKTKITTTTTIEDLKAGDKVQFYGVGTSTTAYGDNPEVKISGGTAQVKVYGNIMSLVDEENFATKTDLPSSEYVFYGLFYGNANLTDASGLLLPAMTLTEDCYRNMFAYCTALTAAPELPATTLVGGCYMNMFNGCSKLASVTCKATDITADNCLFNWLTSAGTQADSPTLYVDPSMTSNTGWNNGVFTVTAVQGAAAEEQQEEAVTAATPLTMECLSDGTIKVDMSGTLTTGMQYAVNGGEKTTITTTTTIEGLTTGDKVQFYGVGTSTQVYGNSPEVKISGGTATVKVYGNIMSLLDEENFATKTDLPSYVFYGLFRENAKLTDASGLLLPATTLAFSCYSYMFYQCSELTAAPELPATTLANYCYSNMFYKCSKLASVTCKATNISATDCLDSWLYNAGTDPSVITSRTLYVDPSMVSNTGWQNAGFTITAIPGN